MSANPPQLRLEVHTMPETIVGKANDLCPLALIRERLKFTF
jgi:hypothetical protein